MQKTLLVTQRILQYEKYSETWECLDNRLYAFLQRCDAMPLGISFNYKDSLHNMEMLLDSVDGIVLSGGNDIGEFPMRDAFECLLIESAIRKHKKILGICRGMQMIATYFGASLSASSHDIRERHKLQGILSHEVTSFHNFCISSLPDGFYTLGSVRDEIEAMRGQGRFSNILALMWHPEREDNIHTQQCDIELIRGFLHD